MKSRFSFLWAAFALLVALPACGPYIPSNATARPTGSMGPARSTGSAGSALVKIECRDAPAIRQRVLELLRSGRGKDISVVANGSFLMITAAFSPTDTPSGRLAQMLQDLQDMGGVTHVEMVENPRPILQSF